MLWEGAEHSWSSSSLCSSPPPELHSITHWIAPCTLCKVQFCFSSDARSLVADYLRELHVRIRRASKSVINSLEQKNAVFVRRDGKGKIMQRKQVRFYLLYTKTNRKHIQGVSCITMFKFPEKKKTRLMFSDVFKNGTKNSNFIFCKISVEYCENNIKRLFFKFLIFKCRYLHY